MSRALAFLDDALSRHGRPQGPDSVVVPCSQAELAAEAGRSAGTIAYYLNQLAGIVRREPDGLVVDLAALATARQRPLEQRRPRTAEVARQLVASFGTGDEVPIRLVEDDGRPPRLRTIAAALGLSPSTAQRHLDALVANGRLRRQMGSLLLWPEGTEPEAAPGPPPRTAPGVAEDAHVLIGSTLLRVAQDLERLATTLLASTTAGSVPRVSRAPLALVSGETRGFAARGSFEGSNQLERKTSPSLEDPTRAPVRGSGFADQPTPVTSRTTALTDRAGIERCVAPLVALCNQLRLPVSLNDEGRRWLALYTEDELARGVEEVVRQLRGQGPAISRPLGLLVAKAKRGDEDFFAAPPPAPVSVVRQPVPETDVEAAAAVANMGPQELEALDAEIRASVPTPRLLQAAEADPKVWDAYRHHAWRAREPREA